MCPFCYIRQLFMKKKPSSVNPTFEDYPGGAATTPPMPGASSAAPIAAKADNLCFTDITLDFMSIETPCTSLTSPFYHKFAPNGANDMSTF